MGGRRATSARATKGRGRPTSTLGSLPFSRASTDSCTQWVTHMARVRISITMGKEGGPTRSSTVFWVPLSLASSSPVGTGCESLACSPVPLAASCLITTPAGVAEDCAQAGSCCAWLAGALCVLLSAMGQGLCAASHRLDMLPCRNPSTHMSLPGQRISFAAAL